MAIKPFNSVGGYSVGPNLEIAIDGERSANLVNVTVNGNLTLTGDDIQLGDVANVHIDGGVDGQYLATDGTGNLSWVTLDTDTLANGTSNVSIDSANGNITFGVNGTANVVTISDTGLDIGGASSANLEFGSAANVFTSGADNIDIFTNNKSGSFSEVALNHGSNVLIVADGNGWSFNADGSTQFPGFTLDSATTPTTAQVLTFDGTTATWATVDTDTLSNGTSNVSIDAANGPVTLGVGGTANLAVFATTGLTVLGTVDATSFVGEAGNLANITGANVTGDVAGADHANIADVANSIAGANVVGNVASAELAYALDSDLANVTIAGGTAGQYLATNGLGTLTWTTLDTDTLANGTSNVSIDAENGPVTVGVGGTANIAVFDTTGLGVTGDITATGDVSGVNISASTDLSAGGNLAVTGTTTVTGNANLQSTLRVAGDITAVANANVGGDLAVTGNVSFASGTAANLALTYGLSTANLAANGIVTLGAVGNVSITGGSNGHVLTTNGSGALSWTNQSIKYTREIHVDPALGNDTTGDGSYNRPYATIMKAHSIVTSGFTVFLHVGSYTETVNWTKTNCDIVGLSAGGMVNTSGAWTVGTTTPSSVRLKDISFGAAFTQNSTGRVIFQSCYLRNTFTKTSGEYTQFDDTDAAGTGIAINSAGTVVFNGGSQNLITVNNAAAVVSVNNTIATASITVTAGTVVTSDSYIYALTNTGNAVTSSAGTAVYLYNSHCIAPNNTIARISMAGFWTANDTQYDKANSTLTGTNLGTISHFDAINTHGLANVGSLQVRGTSTLGAVGNVTITGGTAGQYLQTNGTGTLSFSTVSLSNINNGTSNVMIATANGDVTIASNGQANIATFASNGTFATTTINDDVIITGNLTVQGNTVSVNVTELNIEDPIITEGRGANGAPLSAADGKDRGVFSYYFDGTEKGAFAGYMTTGPDAGQYVIAANAVVVDNVVTVNSYGNVVVGNVIGNLAKGTTSVGIAGADGDITLSVDGTANVVVVTGSGMTVNGDINVAGSTTIGGNTVTTASVTTTELISVTDGVGAAVEFFVKGVDATGGNFESSIVMAISDGAGTCDYTIYGSVRLGTTVGVMSVAVSGGAIQLSVTPSSANSTVWTAQYRMLA